MIIDTSSIGLRHRGLKSWALFVGISSILALVGCGDDERDAASIPAATTPTATAEPTASAPSAPPPPTDAPGTGTATGGGDEGGDEIPIRVPLRFELAGGAAEPRGAAVPGFLAIEIELVSADGAAHSVSLTASGRSYGTRVPAGGSATIEVPGLRPGRYELLDGGEPVALIVAGAQPGP